ncbi:MAG: helix-turn-helix transcriptional regulator [Clostridia bacterium]|nr:helix-turn-helix transcriptional regulator [Clostridia bacterium]
MIVFEKLFEKMAQMEVSTYRLCEECGIDSKTVRRLKANDNIETKTLNKLCAALDCKIEDIMEYIPDC